MPGQFVFGGLAAAYADFRSFDLLQLSTVLVVHLTWVDPASSEAASSTHRPSHPAALIVPATRQPMPPVLAAMSGKPNVSSATACGAVAFSGSLSRIHFGRAFGVEQSALRRPAVGAAVSLGRSEGPQDGPARKGLPEAA